MDILDFPYEILLLILYYLDIESVINLASINKLFFNLTKEYKNINFNVTKLPLNYKKYYFIKHVNKIENFIDYNYRIDRNFLFYLLEGKIFNIKIFILFNCQNLTTKNIKNFLEHSGKLEKIKLKVCYNFNDNNLEDLINNNKNLKVVSITRSMITDNKLLLLNNLKKLHSIELSDNEWIRGLNLDKIFIDNLACFKLKYCTVDQDKLNIFIKNHPFLKLINTKGITFTNDIFSTISKNCKNIKYLSLNIDTDIPNFIDNSLSDMENLIYLDLSYSRIISRDIKYLVSKIKNIETINLHCTHIDDLAAVYICLYLPKIKNIDISYNNISNISLDNLSLHITNKLNYLNLSGTDITLKSILNLTNNIKIDILFLQDIQNISKKYIKLLNVKRLCT